MITAGTVVLPDRVCRPGWIETSGERIVDCGPDQPPRRADREFPDATIVPGFVDIHVHGGGGAAYTSRNPAEIRAAADFHLRHGTTTTLASLVTAAPEVLREQVSAVTDLVGRTTIAGIHLEGPWLSAARCGAHDRTQLRVPDPAELAALHNASGAIRMVTVAPELPGAAGFIEALVNSGIVAAVGHTDATYAQTLRAIDAGATVGTHVFNAMRPLHHREPGPSLALIEDARVTVELIADGVHLHDSVFRHVLSTAGPERVALITDAMTAAGMPDGAYHLGDLDVVVDAGIARLSATATIAGSTATMDRVFRAAVGPVPSDDTLCAAARMTASTPARAIGIDNVGSLRPGNRADLVVLTPELHVDAVLCAGVWVGEPDDSH
ncbi:N-acetylglucosamine-6-phosphate deacetylase [Skermania sp. ID1734]|uniref:N-acetylglucosamine-6-phosphate deacetylase n=1 Tax=Skermania sp. ID1734 TaxID=2597516 RepID=UPI00117C0251|nr:N-acetylglucosamine-6-phosphate deacetylase [Skermania sp. ID1734]TSD95079.1 N-acetylglucosamine-6-phosphate deacetylase [Skermania sp. ID1734]